MLANVMVRFVNSHTASMGFSFLSSQDMSRDLDPILGVNPDGLSLIELQRFQKVLGRQISRLEAAKSGLQQSKSYRDQFGITSDFESISADEVRGVDVLLVQLYQLRDEALKQVTQRRLSTLSSVERAKFDDESKLMMEIDDKLSRASNHATGERNFKVALAKERNQQHDFKAAECANKVAEHEAQQRDKVSKRIKEEERRLANTLQTQRENLLSRLASSERRREDALKRVREKEHSLEMQRESMRAKAFSEHQSRGAGGLVASLLNQGGAEVLKESAHRQRAPSKEEKHLEPDNRVQGKQKLSADELEARFQQKHQEFVMRRQAEVEILSQSHRRREFRHEALWKTTQDAKAKRAEDIIEKRRQVELRLQARVAAQANFCESLAKERAEVREVASSRANQKSLRSPPVAKMEERALATLRQVCAELTADGISNGKAFGRSHIRPLDHKSTPELGFEGLK